MNVTFSIFLWEKRQCSMLRYHIFSIQTLDATFLLLVFNAWHYLPPIFQFIFCYSIFSSLPASLSLSFFFFSNKVIEFNLIVHFWNGLVSTKEDKRYEFLMCDYSSLHSKQVNGRKLPFVFKRNSISFSQFSFCIKGPFLQFSIHFFFGRCDSKEHANYSNIICYDMSVDNKILWSFWAKQILCMTILLRSADAKQNQIVFNIFFLFTTKTSNLNARIFSSILQSIIHIIFSPVCEWKIWEKVFIFSFLNVSWGQF